MLLKPLAAVLSFCLVAGSAQAQVISGSLPPAAQDLTTEERESANKLLDSVIDDSDVLRCAENRSLIRATAAGLLWTRDEERARALFRQAIADLAAITFDARAPVYQRANDAQAARGLRYQVLHLVAEHDTRLALEALRSSRGTFEWVTQLEPHQQDDESRLEMSFAQRVAADDPQLAIEIAEANLEKGLTTEITSVLWQMQEKHPAEAARLARRITERLREPGAATDRQTFYAVTNLLHTAAQQVSPDTQNSRGSIAPPRQTPLFDARALGEIAEFVAARMLDGSMPPYEAQFMTTLAPAIERYAPARSAAVQRRTTEVRRNADPQMRVYSDFNERMQRGTVDDMLAWVARTPPEMRDNFYQQIAHKTLNEGDHTRARQIAEQNLKSPSQRQSLLAQIEQRAAYNAIQADRLDEARARINSITAPEERFNALLQFASTLKLKKQVDAARLVIGDALAMIDADMSGGALLLARLQLAGASAGIDDKRGLAIVAEVVELLTPLFEHAAALDEYVSHQRAFKDGELLLTQGGSPVNDIYRNWAQALQSLATSDADGAASIAGQAARPEIRAMARLMILQSVFGRGGSNRRVKLIGGGDLRRR